MTATPIACCHLAATASPQIPAHKVKLVVGAGGEKIKFIQKKAKCRIQVCVHCLAHLFQVGGFWGAGRAWQQQHMRNASLSRPLLLAA